jgi:hypothetical protein
MALMHREVMQIRVAEEIRKIVANAITEQSAVDACRYANDLLEAYPNCGLRVDQIETVITLAVVRVQLQGRVQGVSRPTPRGLLSRQS